MTIKVEFFETNNIWKLQDQINDFINKLKYFTFTPQITYNILSSHLPEYSDDDFKVIYTAMVIYDGKIVEEKDEGA